MSFETHVTGETIAEINERAEAEVRKFFGRPMAYRITFIGPHTIVGDGRNRAVSITYEATVVVSLDPVISAAEGPRT